MMALDIAIKALTGNISDYFESDNNCHLKM